MRCLAKFVTAVAGLLSFARVDAQIVNGVEAGPTPYQVQLRFAGELSVPGAGEPPNPRPEWSRRHLCGATLIATRWVLTAAHCLFDKRDGQEPRRRDDSEIRIRVGLVNIENPAAGFEERGARSFIHPDYHHSRIEGVDRFPPHRDFALLLLEKPLPLDRPMQIDVARMTTARLGAGRTVLVTGWGQIENSNLQKPAVLRRAELKIVGRGTCNTRYRRPNGPRIIPASGVICTEGRGVAGDPIDTCRGDSGGPVVVMQGPSALLVGVVSWGPCGTTRQPSVHGEVRTVENWIEQTIARQAPSVGN